MKAPARKEAGAFVWILAPITQRWWLARRGSRSTPEVRRMRLGPPLPVVVAVASGCRAQVVEQRVLFVGNSYLFTNDLPAMFKALAEAKRHRVEVGMAATGGWALEQHEIG